MGNIGGYGLDLQDSLEFVSVMSPGRPSMMMSDISQLKDALTIHFMTIRDAGSCFGHDHADILKGHIDSITTCRPSKMDSPQVDDENPAQIAVLPRAISRFAPRATFNPAPNWGNFSKSSPHLTYCLTCV